MKAAREKAMALAAALGQEIGKAQTIEETPEPAYQVYGYVGGLANKANEARSRGQGGPSLAAGQKSILASVVVSFDLI